MAVWLLLLATALGAQQPPALVAHGGGAVGGRVMTNSRQALDASAALGHVLVELDLSWTADDQLVLLHDWQATPAHLFADPPEGVMTRQAFRSARSLQGLEHLALEDLGPWLAAHPGVDIVTDVKDRPVEGLGLLAGMFPDRLERFVPQIYAPDQHAAVRAMGFSRVILTLYAHPWENEQVIDFVRAHDPWAVTMPVSRARGTLARQLGAMGVFVYAHTVNNHHVAAALRANGVSGLYTDFMSPALSAREQAAEGFGAWIRRAALGPPVRGRVLALVGPADVGLQTVLVLRNEGRAAAPVTLAGHDAAGAEVGRHELLLEPGAGRELQLRAVLPAATAWVRVLAERVWAGARYDLVERPSLDVSLAARCATEAVLSGSAQGLAGHLLAVVNPFGAACEVRLRRRVDGRAEAEETHSLAPGAQLVRIWPCDGNGLVEVRVDGGPFVFRALRWNVTQGYVR